MPPERSLDLAILIDEDCHGGRGIMFRNATNMAASDVATMAIHGRGLIGAVVGRGRAFALDLAPMRGALPRIGRPQFLASIEAIACSETGISALERATTIAALGSWSSTPAHFHSPGHVFPAVPAENPAEWQLSDVAYHYCGIRQGALATAWCDILDPKGDVANAAWCRELACALNLPLLTRSETLFVIDRRSGKVAA